MCIRDRPKAPLYFTQEEIIYHAPAAKDTFDINFADGIYYVTGPMIKRLLGSVNLDDSESRAYFQRVLKNKGVFEELERMGIKESDTVDIYGMEFEYYK